MIKIEDIFIVDVHTHPMLLGVTADDILLEAKSSGVSRCFLLAVDIDESAIEREDIKRRLNARYNEAIVNSIFSPHSYIIMRYGFSGYEAYKNYLKTLVSFGSRVITNDELAEIVRKKSDFFVGLGSIAPTRDRKFIRKELRKIKELKLKGVKLLPTLQLFDPSRNKNFLEICEFCEKEKLIVMIHTGCDPGPFELPEMCEWANPNKLRNVLEVYSPNIVLAHLGSYSAYNPGIWLNEALELGKKFDNVWYDTSAVNYYVFNNVRVLERIKSSVGLDRIMFGSDYPAVEGSTIRREINFILKCEHLTDKEKEKILGLNSLEFFDLR